MDSYDFLYDMAKHWKTLTLNQEAKIMLKGEEMEFILKTNYSEIVVPIRSVRCLEESFILNDQVKVKLSDKPNT